MTESPSPARLLETPLHSRHIALGANMAPFAGWDMPLWYKSGAIKEHLAVIRAAGLFDTSHMDVVWIEGEGGRELLDWAYSRDLTDMRLGRAVYGAFLNHSGHCIDDAIIYPITPDRMAVVANAGMGKVICEHLRGIAGHGAATIRLPDARIAKIDLQGPASVAILREHLADADRVLGKFPYFSFQGDFDFARSPIMLRDGTPVLLSRTGYTGELGFEIFIPWDRVGGVWDAFLVSDANKGLLPCGLAARDSLRTGAVLPLSHQDIGAWPFVNHPWTFALPLAADGSYTKDFLGHDALDSVHCPYTLPFVGYDPRRVDPTSATVLLEGREIGIILTIVTDMAIGWHEGAIAGLATPGLPEGWTPKGLACGFVKVDAKLEPGAELTLRDARREIKVEIARDIRPDRTARKKIVL